MSCFSVVLGDDGVVNFGFVNDSIQTDPSDAGSYAGGLGIRRRSSHLHARAIDGRWSSASGGEDEERTGRYMENGQGKVWRQGGQDPRRPYGVQTHHPPVHACRLDKDGKVVAAIGGPYILKGDKYEETPEYGLGDVFAIVKGKPQSFTWKVQGNRWYHSGTLTSGLTIEGVWERVENK
jgi:hypothetical protein